MPLYLVRHAKAGSRSDFDGDDIDRPLTNSGRRQADELCRRLSAVSPSVVVSSPYRRCIETVERLAELGSDHAKPDTSLFDLLYSLPDHAVVCSHGDVIPALIEALGASGMRVQGAPEWGKGSVWVLERHESRFVTAHAWAPPVVE